MKNKFGLDDRTIKTLVDYFKSKAEISKVKIYGSRAKGTYTTGSDIDLALWLDREDILSRIYDELDNLPTPYKFDLTNYKTLSHEGIKKSIDKEGILFFKRS